MIFKRISYHIAAQFTAFVFLLLLITGGIFLAADVINRNRQTYAHLNQILQPILNNPETATSFPQSLTPFQRNRVRLVEADGNRVLFSGEFYEDIPFIASDGLVKIESEHEAYYVLTLPLTQKGVLKGYIQVADRAPPEDLEIRILLFLLISAAISLLTFGVGLFFARRSLRPAEQMMDRLEQFTQDASHELRTPITAVSTSLDLALMTGEYKENVTSAKKGLRDINVLIERLLELARLDSFTLQKESIDLSALLAQSIEKHRMFALEKNISIRSHIAPNIRVKGDATLIAQVIGNLLMNAIKFNKRDGTVDVTLDAQKLSVADTGKGIPDSALPHIFDRFFQVDDSRSESKNGLGLGLALVKRIVDLHDWTISVHSREKEGTTFTLKFA